MHVRADYRSPTLITDGSTYIVDQILEFLQMVGRVVAVIALYIAIAWVINKLLNGRIRNNAFFNRYGKNGSLFAFRLVTVTIYIVMVLAALSRLGVDTGGILTLVSAFTVAIGLSLQDVLRNLFAGMFMLAEKPFSVGDRVLIRDRSGVVQGIDVRTTMIRTEDGALLMVPNQLMFTEIIQNDSRYNRRAARYQVRSKLNGDELARRVTEAVGKLEGVQLIQDSLQLIEHDEQASKWQVTLAINARKAVSNQQLDDALISALPDCTISRADFL